MHTPGLKVFKLLMISLLPFSFFFSVNQSADWHKPLRFGKGRGEELGYGVLYGNIVTLPNGLNVAVPV